MANRFVFQKFASGMSRSTTSRLSAHASASTAAKTGWSTVGMPSIINNKKSAFVGSVGGVKRTFTSAGASNKLEQSYWEAKLTAWRTRGATWARKKAGLFGDAQMRSILLLTAFYAFSIAPLPADRSGCSKGMAGGPES